MRKARIAEWILSLVTSPERAASTVGDLLETESTFRFWLAVIRTACFVVWHDFSREWPRTLGFATVGLLAYYTLPIIFAVGYGIAWGLILMIANGLGIADLGHLSNPPLGSTNALIRTSTVVGVLTVALVAFQIGRWMARRSRGRELVPCVAMVALDTVVSSAINVWWGNRHLSALTPALPLCLAALLFAGAIKVRRANLRSQ